MTDFILKILKKIDPKWLPAILGGIGISLTVIYLIYAKKRADALNAELKKKVALAESDALNSQIAQAEDEAKDHRETANKKAEEVEAIKRKLKRLRTNTLKRKEKLLAATSWEDLNL